MSYTAIRARAEARILDSLFLKWQSFPNVSGFQTLFSIQLSSNYLFSDPAFCRPFKSNEIPRRTSQTLRFTSLPLLLTTLQSGQALLCSMLGPMLGLLSLLPALIPQSIEATFISPSLEQLSPPEVISYVYSLSCLRPLAYQLHKEGTLPSRSLLCSLYLTQQKAVSKF